MTAKQSSAVTQPTGNEGDPVLVDVTGSYSTYLEYNKILRTWLVAFGAGGPALFLVNEKIAERLAAAGELRFVVLLFLVGAGAQVIGAFLNKVANWYVHFAYTDGEALGTWKHVCAEWLVAQFWIDVLLDVLSISVLGYSAWSILTVFSMHVR